MTTATTALGTRERSCPARTSLLFLPSILPLTIYLFPKGNQWREREGKANMCVSMISVCPRKPRKKMCMRVRDTRRNGKRESREWDESLQKREERKWGKKKIAFKTNE